MQVQPSELAYVPLGENGGWGVSLDAERESFYHPRCDLPIEEGAELDADTFAQRCVLPSDGLGWALIALATNGTCCPLMASDGR